MTDAAAGPRLSATPADVRLGPLSMVRDGGARNVVVQMKTGRFHGFVVRRGQTVVGYVDRCPHMALPLAQTLDDYLTPGGATIRCSWHGAIFAVEDGRCLGGPCAGARLTPWPVRVEGDSILTGAPTD